MGKIKDMSGQKFGRWTVLEAYQKIFPKTGDKYFYVQWECRCDCGATRFVNGKALRSGMSMSCGHDTADKYRAAVTHHGQSYTRIYNIWKAIKRRCFYPKATGYENYGGRGITVCPRWKDSFEAFYKDMAAGYADHLSIDRIDNYGNYEPGNCRWATRSDQMKNRRPFSEWRRRAA